MPWKETLENSLSALQDDFKEGELAYLWMTSKAELVTRDRLAHALHLSLSAEGKVVAREWGNRYDLAVLNEAGEAECIVEFKGYLSCDAINRTRRDVIRSALEQDAEKLQTAVQIHPAASCFQLLLIARPSPPDEAHHPGYSKYLAKLRQDPVHSGEHLAEAVLERYRLNETGQWDGGRTFGIEVCVHYWLFPAGQATEPPLA